MALFSKRNLAPSRLKLTDGKDFVGVDELHEQIIHYSRRLRLEVGSLLLSGYDAAIPDDPSDPYIKGATIDEMSLQLAFPSSYGPDGNPYLDSEENEDGKLTDRPTIDVLAPEHFITDDRAYTIDSGYDLNSYKRNSGVSLQAARLLVVRIAKPIAEC